MSSGVSELMTRNAGWVLEASESGGLRRFIGEPAQNRYKPDGKSVQSPRVVAGVMRRKRNGPLTRRP